MRTIKLNVNGKIIAILSLIGIIAVTCIVVIVNIAIEKQISKTIQSHQHIVGDTIELASERILLPIDRLLQNMAAVASQLPPSVQNYELVFPQLLASSESALLIAGAGIWPRPRALASSQERKNYYWGHTQDSRNKKTAIRFERNSSLHAKNFARTDWYKSAISLKKGQTFWSTQYSKIPSGLKVLTVAAPYFDARNKRKGVISIDVLLVSINQKFADYAQRFSGYLVALDNTSTMVMHPANISPDLAEIVQPYTSIKTLAQKHPTYNKIISTMDAARQQLQKMPITSEQRDNPIISIFPALNEKQQSKLGNSERLSLIEIQQDIIIKKAAYATMFYIPRIDWFVMSIASQTKATAGTSDTTRNIIMQSLLALLITFTLGYMILIRTINAPATNAPTTEKVTEDI